MLSDLRHGVWTELYGTAPVKIDVYRRGLQRAYLTDVGNKINPPAAGAAAGGRGGGGGGGRGGAAPAANTGEIKAMLRGELKTARCRVGGGGEARDRRRRRSGTSTTRVSRSATS